MTKFGRFDSSTGEFQIEFTPGGTCNFEALAAVFIGTPAVAGVAGTLSTTATAGLLGSGGVFGAAGATLSAVDLISGGFSAFSAISNIAAGQAAQVASTEAALFEEFGAKQEILKGRKEALDILQREQEILEQNIVSAAASGLTGEGSVKAAQQAIISKAEFETGITRTTAELNAAARRQAGRQSRIEGAAAATAGVTAAAGDVAGFFLNRSRRGTP